MLTRATECPSTGASTTLGASYHVSALAGDVLVDGAYRPVEIVHEPDGLVWGHSAVLGLDLCWDAGELRFRDPGSGEFLLTPEEQGISRMTEAVRADRAEAEVRSLRERLKELEGRQ